MSLLIIDGTDNTHHLTEGKNQTKIMLKIMPLMHTLTGIKESLPPSKIDIFPTPRQLKAFLIQNAAFAPSYSSLFSHHRGGGREGVVF